MEDTSEYSKVIFENMEKGLQLRLTVSDFRNVEYVHLRKYFLNYEGEWIPSKEGATMPYSISNSFALLDGLLEIVSNSEQKDVLITYLKDKLNEQST